MRMKHLIILFCLLSVFIFGCSKKDSIMEQAKDDMVVFNSKNAHDINMLIWGSDDISNHSSTSSIEVPDTENSSIIDSIIKNVQVEIVTVKNNKAILKVTAPNLESFFEDAINTASEINDDVLLAKYMIDYIEQAELITKEVEVDIVEKEGNMRIDYTDPMFINAFTGGLVDGYTSTRNSLFAQ